MGSGPERKWKMALAIKGDPEIDNLAEQKGKEFCQYIKENLKQLGEPVLRELLLLFEEASISLRAGLEVRIKQEIGGKYAVKFSELNARVDKLEEWLREPENQSEDEGVEDSSEGLSDCNSEVFEEEVVNE